MKKIFDISIKTLLLVIIILLLINAIILFVGGIWEFGYTQGACYKTNRLTGKTYFIAGDKESPVNKDDGKLTPTRLPSEPELTEEYIESLSTEELLKLAKERGVR